MMFFWILLIPLFFYWFSRSEHPITNPLKKDAMEILRERYARGEIGIQEFEERKQELSI